MPLLSFQSYFQTFSLVMTQNQVPALLSLIELEDYQIGGSGADRLYGHSDHDLMMGMGGNDAMWGYAGRDLMHGGFGNDSMWGGADGDSMHGCFGNDLIFGSTGGDFIHGGLGRDTLSGQDGNDSLHGCLGDDRLLGGKGQDFLHGGFGDDTLLGEQGNDSLHGCFGDDRLDGGDGNDLLSGGYGQDVFVFRSGHDTIVDYELGGGCQDDCGCDGPTTTTHFTSTEPLTGDVTSVDVTGMCHKAEYAERIIIKADGIDSYDALIATASQQGEDVVFAISQNDSLTLVDVDLADLSEQAFVFV